MPNRVILKIAAAMTFAVLVILAAMTDTDVSELFACLGVGLALSVVGDIVP